MQHDVDIALRVLLAATLLAGFAWALVALVRAARSPRKRGRGLHAAGAMLMLFGWGNLRDPGDNPVAEAQEGRARRGEESGDPPK